MRSWSSKLTRAIYYGAAADPKRAAEFDSNLMTPSGVLRPAYCGLLGLPINSGPCEWGRGGRGQ